MVDYTYMTRGALGMFFHARTPWHYITSREEKTTVILIPGIFGKWGFMKKIADSISEAGHPVYVVPNLGYNTSSISDTAKKVKAFILHLFPRSGHIIPHMHQAGEKIVNLLEKENLDRVVLVTHSKGGLVGKFLLTHLNKDHRVLGMVAIAAPFSGSAITKFFPLRSVKELSEHSAVINHLEQDTSVNHQIISIYPEYDNHVWSEKGSFLEGAENILVPVRGHHKVLFSKEVQKIVIDSVEKLSKEKSL